MNTWGTDGKETIAEYIVLYLKTKGRINAKLVPGGYKYTLGISSIFQLIWPGRKSYPVPKFLANLDKKISRIFRTRCIHRAIEYYQFYIYKRAYRAAVKKYKNMKKEILASSPHSEVL